MNVLVGDIGGTHARLAIFRLAKDGPERDVLARRVDESRRYDGPVPLVRAFLAKLEEEEGALALPEAACLALPCPVVGGVCRLPNLHWEVEVAGLGAAIGIEPTLAINDFDALGHALPLLRDGDLVELQAGEPEPEGTIGLIGPGTGLGCGFLTWEGRGYRVHSSEGGHADFAPREASESRLLEYLSERYGRASWERVLSGPGLADLYRFLVADEHAPERAETRTRLEGEDPGRVITELGMRGEDPLCAAALDRFVSVLGAQAANLALTLQSTGGVYIGGGIAPRILSKLQEGSFLQAFRAKGRMADLVRRVPVRVITEPQAGLLGAAAALHDHLRPNRFRE